MQSEQTIGHRSATSAQGDWQPVVRGSMWSRWIVTRKAKKR